MRFINIDQILISAVSPEDMPLAMREVNGLLRERHHLAPVDDDDFQVVDMTEMRKAFTAAAEP